MVLDGIPLRPWRHPRVLELGEGQRSGVVLVKLYMHLGDLLGI